jgi:hypothetical protein
MGNLERVQLQLFLVTITTTVGLTVTACQTGVLSTVALTSVL